MKRRAGALTVLATLVLLGALVVPAGAGPQGKSGGRNERLKMYEAVVDAATVERLTSEGYDVASVEPVLEGYRVTLVLYRSERAGLEKQGVDLRVWRNDAGLTSTQLASQQLAAGFKVWRPYDGSNGLQKYMEDLAASSSLVDIKQIGMTDGFNADGSAPTPRPIYALKVEANADSNADGNDPAVLYTSLQHAREWISTEVNRRLLEWYLKKYTEGVPQVVNLLRTTELWFVLVANPDGYQYTHDPAGDRLWRKNLADNDGDYATDGVDSFDGVDPNRNFREHWGYDDEGSASITSDETYRGPSAGSEPETAAMERLYGVIDPVFHINYHSFGELLLYSFGWQVQTPSADDPVFSVLSGTDKKPAIAGFNPGVGADLYITNGETTDWAHAQGTLAWTPELSEGPNGDGFVFPDSNGAVENEFKKNLPFALDVALSASDPDDPVSHQGFSTEPFYLDVSELDPQKAHNPLGDFSFAFSYGDPQPVQVLAKRDLNDDDEYDGDDDVTVHWSVNGGDEQTAAATEWDGGDRFGGVGDRYYRIVGADVSDGSAPCPPEPCGLDVDDSVEVWFTGGGQTSDSFTFEVVEDDPADVLILAAEDYTGAANFPAYSSTSSPNFLDYYEDALVDRGTDFDVYDVDAMGRVAPDHLGVLSHYSAVIWYTGNDYLTREPGQVAGTGASTLANSEILEVRSYLNEGGKLLFTGRHAGWQYANAFPYNPVSTPPFCDSSLPNKQGIDCLLLSDDFLQYYLGAYLFIEDGGTVDDEPAPIDGLAPFTADWTLNGGTSADNHHANPIRGTTQSFLTTSSLQPVGEFPQFTSSAVATWVTPSGGAFAPHNGSAGYVYSDRADISYKRLVQEIDVPDSGDQTLEFYISYDTEADWDYVFVEARTAEPDATDYVTLPDINGHTSNSTALDADNGSCPAGWFELHPHLELYQGADCGGADFLAPDWNAASGRSAGWEPWSVDLSNWAGGNVEVSISYVSDWAIQGIGAFVDDIDAPGAAGDATFDAGLDGWTVMDGTTFPEPDASAPNANNWFQTGDVGFEEGAAVTMDPPNVGDGAADFMTLYFGFGFEGITDEADRFAVMDDALTYFGIL